MQLPAPLIHSLKTGSPPALVEAPLPAHAYVLIEAARATGKPIIHVLPQDKDMAATAALCQFLAPDLEILTLPAWDTLPYDRVSPSHAIIAARLNTLSYLATQTGDKPYILLTTVNAVTQKLPPREQFAKARFAISKGKTLNREALFAFLSSNGYQRVGKVMEAGEYAVRGSLIDLFPSGYPEAIRIDLFGDDIESLRSFDPLTQISDTPVDSLELRAVTEILLQPETISQFRKRYLELFGAVTKDDPLYESISEARTYAGMEHWLPLFYPHLDTLADYCPNAIFSTDHRLTPLLTERDDTIADYYGARKLHQKKDGNNYNPIPPELLFLTADKLMHSWRTHSRMTITPFAAEGAIQLNLRLSPQLFNRRHEENQHLKDILLDYIRNAELPIILAANSNGSADRIAKMLNLKWGNNDTTNAVFLSLRERLGEGLLRANVAVPSTTPAQAAPSPNPLPQGEGFRAEAPFASNSSIPQLTILPLEQGFTTPEFILLTEQDMFGERIIRTVKKRKKSEAFLAEAASFIEGELIVHREHGIGKFEGLITLEVNNTRHDCLKLIYDGGDKLFLPVENIDLVSRYGTAEGEIQLDKLGGVAWQKRKSALKKRLKMAAEVLIKVAAERASIPASTLAADAGLYDEFVDRFPYTETEDQLSAIEEVRADLLAGHAMDRLVCGDVGFGKTEVALRAAFIAASAGQQVAIVAPTTLLARQHYKTFTDRFRGITLERIGNEDATHSASPSRGEATRLSASALSRSGEGALTSGAQPQSTLTQPSPLEGEGFPSRTANAQNQSPITIRMLSRLTSAKEAAETKTLLPEGKVDITIGTHALLAAGVQFKNLGLLIVDEEQHFGVAQKEKLKQLKSNIHVLTLSATPIPRTLQLSLSGVRELSLITTPPVDRLAVRTYVMPWDPVVLREAIMREYHRGGKIFVVTPRVKYMAELKQKLTELVPEVKIVAAHGQMGATALDKTMNEFYDGKYDVLLSTTIIESGIDIPTANTIIIDRADMFGLSQLYQLRGRVGRSKTRAYAYLTLPHGKKLNREAERRLEVMQQLDTLGAGFQLASHDMDIRGFGNLLGEEQSGHVKEVGIELYQAMLEEAIADMKRRKDVRSDEEVPDSWSPQINLGMSVLIPESYVEDLPLRLSLYRRAASLATSAELESFAAELVDRFGQAPIEVDHLIATLHIKLLCKTAHIIRLDVGPKGVVLAFRNNKFANPTALIDHIAKNTARIKLRADQTVFISAETKSEAERLATANAVANEIAKLLPAASDTPA